MNLSDTDVPVVGVVTRLTHQKGIHLIKHAAFRTLERGGQFVLLGSAPDPRVQVRSFTANDFMPCFQLSLYLKNVGDKDIHVM
jgi:glycogen synthase